MTFQLDISFCRLKVSLFYLQILKAILKQAVIANESIRFFYFLTNKRLFLLGSFLSSFFYYEWSFMQIHQLIFESLNSFWSYVTKI